MDKYKIYRSDNYIIVINTSNSDTQYGFTKEVFIDKSNINIPSYRIFNVRDFDEKLSLSINQILKEDGSSYTQAEFEDFYKKNTGNFNDGGNSQGVQSVTGSSVDNTDPLNPVVLPDSTKLDKGTYTGASAQTLKDDIDSIYQPNVLISSVTPTRVTNTFTYSALGVEALINKVRYKNPTSYSTTIGAAATDFKRTDVVYIGVNGVMGTQVGTEVSTTVAPIPNIPANTVVVGYINVYGATIDPPIPSTPALSFRNSIGQEIYTTSNIITIEGASLDGVNKRVVIDSLVPLSAFLDIVNGNDAVATLENSKKPFKTIGKLISSLPTTSGETYTIYITGGVIPILRKMPIRNFRFVGFTNTTLDFTNCKEDDGVTEAVSVLLNGSGTWTFENANISIVCNFVGTKVFRSAGSNGPILKGNINTLNWHSLSGAFGAFYLPATTDLVINNIYESPQVGQILFWNNSTNYDVRVKNLFCEFGRSIGNTSRMTFDNITKIGTGSLVVSLSFGGYTASFINLGNVTLENCTLAPGSDGINFNGTLSPNTYIAIGGINNLSGTVKSTTYLTAPLRSVTLNFKNFVGKVNNLLIGGAAQVTFENCIIDVNDKLVSRYTAAPGAGGSTREDVIVTKGFNVFNQVDTTANLFTTGLNTGKIEPVIITDYGTIQTNALTFGENTTQVKVNNSFQEKSKERVVRNKKDLVGKPLASNMTYVIDGTITLLTGEYIDVPLAGLTIAGYGFDVSQLNKNVTGQSIFRSPAGNSGNLVLKDMQISSGLSSVFNITDADNTHALEFNDVNFVNCTSLGKISGYRQFTGLTIGMYGCSDGLQLAGTWNGFSLSKLHVRTFASTGTLFKKDTDTSFTNRFFLDSTNVSGVTGIKLLDFDNSNFTKDKLLQITNGIFEVNGVINKSNTTALIPNIDPFSIKSNFINNRGITNSRYTVENGIANDEAVNVGQLSDTIVSSAATLTLSNTSRVMYYTYTGSTPATWTIPPLAGNAKLRLVMYNTGTGTVTINTNLGGNDIYDSGALVNTGTVNPGTRVELFNNSVIYIMS